MVESLVGKLKGKIVERGKGFSSRIRFGSSGLGFLLEGVKESYRDERRGKISKSWEEEGRKYRFEVRSNVVGRFIMCSMVDVGAKHFCFVFPKGRGFLVGLETLVGKLGL